MATRADHFEWADQLVWKARRGLGEDPDDGSMVPRGERRPRVELLLMAAQVHATLAGATDQTYAEVAFNERAAARRVAAAESDRGALGAPDGPAPVVEESPGQSSTTCRCHGPSEDGLPHPLFSVGCEFR